MKFIIALLLTALVSFIAGLYFDWWTIAIVAFLVVLLLPLRSGLAFVEGFLAIFLLWFILALWIDFPNNHILSARIGKLLGVGPNPTAVSIVTGVVGGLVAGLAALTGSFLRPVKRRMR